MGGEQVGSHLLAPVSSLIMSLPAELRLHIFVEGSGFDIARLWIDQQKPICEIDLLRVAMLKSPWIQDHVHVRKRRDADREWTEILSQPDDELASAIASHLGLAQVSNRLFPQGGNQLVGPDFRLVGYSETGRPGERLDRDQRATDQWRTIVEMDGRTVSLFGYRVDDLAQKQVAGACESQSLLEQARRRSNLRQSTDFRRDRIYQCGFHIDQFVSVTGLSIDGRPLLLVADPALLDADGEGSLPKLKTQLDASVRLLEEQGFAIERNPIPLAVTADNGKRLPRLYNNVLVENRPRPGRTQPQVWIPQFGDEEALEAFDRHNLAAWSKLGFLPVPVPGWGRLASRNGAIRCISKVLRRGELA